MLWLAWMALAAGQDWTPSEDATRVHRALSLRHDALSCEDVEALTSTPVETLREMVQHVRAPAWVPMRAATCLATRHGEESLSELKVWVSDEATLGLGMHLPNHLDDMEEPVALVVAEHALQHGPEALDAASRVSGSARPKVQALVKP